MWTTSPVRSAALCVAVGLGACGGAELSRCGPGTARVEAVIDGDTIEIEGGTRVRYLLVDTPELRPQAQCFAQEALAANRALVLGARVQLEYEGAQCEDVYGRLLAYAFAGDTFVNERLVRQGFAELLVIPLGGDPDRVYRYEDGIRAAQAEAQRAGAGLWGACLR